MGNDTVKIAWDKKMIFETEIDGTKINIDSHPDFGGSNSGPRPKPLLLVALGGCSSMDVISMLNKMRVEYDSFEVFVSGEMNNEHPKHYTKINVKYMINGKNLSADKIKKAVEMSEKKYCGVNYMLKQAAEIKSEIFLNNKKA